MKKPLSFALVLIMLFSMTIPSFAAEEKSFEYAPASLSIDLPGGNQINALTASGSAENGTYSGILAIVWNQNNTQVRTITSNIDVTWGEYSRTGDNATQAFAVAQTCAEQTLQFSVVNNNGSTVRSNIITIPACHIPGNKNIIKEAVCEVDGAWEIRCEVCGGLLESGVIDALEHVPGEMNIIKEAACEVDGAWEIRCELCDGLLESGVIDALEHVPGEMNIIKEAACEVDGAWEIRCELCGDLLESGIIEALEHVPGEKNIIKEAACEVDGAWEIRCELCGGLLESGIIEALEHSWDEGTIVDPTLYEVGYTLYTCLNCGDTYKNDFVEWIEYTVEPNCTLEGYTALRYIPTGEEWYSEYTDALGHLHDEPVWDGSGWYIVCYRCGWAGYISYDPPVAEIVLVKAATSAESIVSIVETKKNVWDLTFIVTETFDDGSVRDVTYTVEIGKNSNGEINLGDYTLAYDIKGNGSNIKAFSVIMK